MALFILKELRLLRTSLPKRDQAMMLFRIFVFLLLGLGHPFSMMSLQSTKIGKPEPLTLNLKRCNHDVQTFYGKFGSERLTVVGRINQYCRVDIRHETEGSYKIMECRIPIKMKRLEIREQTGIPDQGSNRLKYSMDISKYCREKRSGNLITGAAL